MKSASVAAMFSAAVWLLAAFPAHADEGWLFAKLTCIPETQLFTLQTVFQWNLPSDYVRAPPENFRASQHGLSGEELRKALDGFRDQHLEYLERRYGLYTAERLAKHPFTCLVPGKQPGGSDLHVKVSGEHSAPGGGVCEPGDETVNVTVNGVDVGPVRLAAGCQSESGTITAGGDGVGIHVQKCSTFHDFSGRAKDQKTHPVQFECQQWDVK